MIDGYGAIVSPTSFVIPWEKNGSASGSLKLISPENQDYIQIDTSWILSGSSCVRRVEDDFVVDYKQLAVDPAWANLEVEAPAANNDPAFINEVVRPINAQDGDLLPVTILVP